MTNQKGFSIVEILLSSTVLVMMVTAFTGAIIYGRQSTQVAGGSSRASFLAQQGVEATRSIRDQSFSNLINGSYGLAVSGNKWVFSGNSDSTNGFVRQVVVSDGSDSNRKIITSTVIWQKTIQRTGNVVVTTELSNWKNN